MINRENEMIVCVCNNVNHQQLHDSVKKGNNTPGKVAKDIGFRYQCGSCVYYIVENIIKEMEENNVQEDI